MLDITNILKTVNTVISRQSGSFYSGITIMNQYKPTYNHNNDSTIKNCKLNLEICKRFYQEIDQLKSAEKVCPFGMTVCKKTFDISTKQSKVCIFSIVEYSSQFMH